MCARGTDLAALEKAVVEEDNLPVRMVRNFVDFREVADVRVVAEVGQGHGSKLRIYLGILELLLHMCDIQNSHKDTVKTH